MIIQSSIIIISLINPITGYDSIKQQRQESGIVLQNYKSPTLDQPYDDYRDKQIEQITERIFIETVKDAK